MTGMTRTRIGSQALIVPATILCGFLVLGFVAATADETVRTTGRIATGAIAALVAILGARILCGGLIIGPGGVLVRGAFRSRRVTWDRLTTVAVERLGDKWCRLAVVRDDGTVTSVWWTLWLTSGTRLPPVVQATASLVAHLSDRSGPPAGDPPSGRSTHGYVSVPGPTLPIIGGAASAPLPGEAVPATVPDHLEPRFPLDREVAVDLGVARWGLGEVLKAFGWLVVLIGAAVGVSVALDLPTIGQFVGEVMIGVAAVLGARKALRGRTLRAALGFSLPKLGDLPIALRWILWQFLGQFVSTAILLALVPAARHENVSNTEGLTDLAVPALVVVCISAVLVAPVVEELFFRGLLLRATMRRFSFWPSAVLTSTVFGLAHAPQGESGVAALVLTVNIGVFGVLQAMLVRRTARLGPAMVVHGIRNALAVVVTLL
jgi:membrane protease YdiL (CAAX protease family)